MYEVVLAGLISVTSATLTAAFTFWLYRKRDSATVDYTEAQTIAVYQKSAKDAWEDAGKLRAEVKELQRFKDAAVPVLLKCAAGDPALYQQMQALRLFENGGEK